jgi:hypothetical protein
MSFRREPRSWPRRGFCVVKSSQSGKQSHPEISSCASSVCP